LLQSYAAWLCTIGAALILRGNCMIRRVKPIWMVSAGARTAVLLQLFRGEWIMTIRRTGFLICVLIFAEARSVDFSPARAQTPGLGGYGAASSMATAGMGGSGQIIPYGGSLSGFMPYRMGGGASALSFTSRNSSALGSSRSSFRLSSMNREKSMPTARFGASLGRRAGGAMFSPASGGGMNQTMDTGRESVIPPNFGYPFYQPPSLLGRSSAFMGMSSM
jgi:hypothetical protein